MSETPTVLIDVEFTLNSGVKEYASCVEGRDVIELDGDPVHLVIRHDDGAVEDITIERYHLALLKVARRTVQPESSHE